MFGYDRIDIIKTDRSRECFICHYWQLLRINFRFQSKACDGCSDMTQKSMTSNDFVNVTIRDNKMIPLWFMAKSEAVDRMKNANLSEEKKQKYDYKKIIYYSDVINIL